jgi:RNA polymerase subunit RPABC4/transcription elongation factor Spt4
MAKNHRGKEVKKLPNQGRGECPACHRTGVKLLYDVKVEDKTIKVCKNCKSLPAEKIVA